MSIKIFIVEDSEVYSRMVEYKLRDAGFDDVSIFESGEACLRKMTEKPTLVLLDFSLKGLNGLDTLNLINTESPKTNTIILTGLKNEKVAQQCIAAGALDFLPKEEESLVKILNYVKKFSKKSNSKRQVTIAFTLILLLVIAFIVSQFV